jgi:hypothetical protein
VRPDANERQLAATCQSKDRLRVKTAEDQPGLLGVVELFVPEDFRGNF